MVTQRDQFLGQLAEGVGGPGTRVADPLAFTKFLLAGGAAYDQQQQAQPQWPGQKGPSAPPPGYDPSVVTPFEQRTPYVAPRPAPSLRQSLDAAGFLATVLTPAVSPIRGTASVIGSLAAPAAVKQLGGGPVAQTAAGVAGGFAGYPEGPLALAKLAGRGTARAGGAIADAGAALERRGLPSPLSTAEAAGVPPVPPDIPGGLGTERPGLPILTGHEPEVQQGFTRLYRGEVPVKEGQFSARQNAGRYFTTDLSVAQKFAAASIERGGQMGYIRFIDVPTSSITTKALGGTAGKWYFTGGQNSRVFAPAAFQQEPIGLRPAPAQGAPPAAPPGGVPPEGGAPPAPPAGEAPVPPAGPPPEVARSLSQAAALVRLDRPGAISDLADKLQAGAYGVRSIRDLERPGRIMPDNILGAHVGETSSRSELLQSFFPSRMALYRQIEDAFGPGVKNGGQAAGVRFLGTPEQAAVSITGTLKDIADNPELYDLNPAQKQVLAEMDARNNGLLSQVNKGYGTEIGQFQPKAGGAFLPNVDVSKDSLQAIEDRYGSPTGPRAVASGRSMERFYQTARDRMAADSTFQPQTDVTQLLRGLDQSKASGAAGQVFRGGVGGLAEEPTASTVVNGQALGAAKAHGYENLRAIGIDRWFPSDEAKIIRDLRQPAATSGPIRTLADIQATVLGGDFSPITIQGMQQFLFHPLSTPLKVIQGKGAFAPDSLAKLVAQDPQGWKDFASATGRSISEPTPGEFGTGYLGKIPKAGPVITEANNRMYNFVSAVTKSHFDDDVRGLERSGLSHEDAIAQAGDLNTKIVPQMNASRYGLSPAQAQARRTPLTSVSFVRKSGELVMDASRGFAKLATTEPVGRATGKLQAAAITPQEALAMQRVAKAAAVVTTLSVTSVVIEAQRNGDDPVQAAKDAINPSSPRFESLVFAGHRFPLGGPLRAIIAATYPREVSGVPFPVPFGGMPRYLQNRIQPGISASIGVIRNTDYIGRQIHTPGEGVPMTAAKIAGYMAENMLPTGPQQAVGDLRRGQLGQETAINTAAQFAGQNASPLNTMSDIRREWDAQTNPYLAIPANNREAMSKPERITRDLYRQRNPEVDAKLFITGRENSLATGKAMQIAVKLMQERRLSVDDIPSLSEKEFDSPAHIRLRQFFINALGEKGKSQSVLPGQGPGYSPPIQVPAR